MTIETILTVGGLVLLAFIAGRNRERKRAAAFINQLAWENQQLRACQWVEPMSTNLNAQIDQFNAQ